jgi:cyclopropane-fatty-acyl-phospholipid synthase
MSGHATHESARESTSRSTQFERRMLARLMKLVGNPNLALELWDGFLLSEGSPAATLVFHDRAALYRSFYKPEFAFGELYMTGRMSIRGDPVHAMEAVYRGLASLQGRGGAYLRLMRTLFSRRAPANSLAGSKRNISAHYDLGNDFYKLWLDQDYMQYTCAYYPYPSATLEVAQAAKLEHVCRKLALRPGETVVEAGGGWGGLARYLVRHYDVTVRSYNISAEQVAYARERAQREGLADRIEYVEDDYRNIEGQYDAFVSVGMLEHVGVRNYPALGETLHRCLKRGGRGLIHSIGQDEARPLNEWIERRIFPGAEPPSLQQMMEVFAPIRFIVCDVENLRSHYAQTLMHWRERFEANASVVESMFDADFVRMWRLYLCGSIAAFTAGRLQLFQVLFMRPDCAVLPPTRAHLYRDAPSVPADGATASG